MRLLVTGATGAVGNEVVRQSLADRRIARVVALTRRPLAHADPRLDVTLLDDFGSSDAIAQVLPVVDACVYALGVSQVQVRDPDRYHAITHGFTLATARALAARSPQARFLFVSGQGADPTMRSRVRFARVKGETERDLGALLGDRLIVYRPGYIHPVRGRETVVWQDTLSRPLWWLRAVLPWLVTNTVEVAHALLHGALGAGLPRVLENRDIRAAARAYRESTLGLVAGVAQARQR
jgi:hypothetical protein